MLGIIAVLIGFIIAVLAVLLFGEDY